MKRPKAGEDRKTNEHQRKSPQLESCRELVLGKELNARGVRSRDDVSGDNPHQYHGAPDKGVKGELHRAIFATPRTPNRDDKILRNDRNFIKDEQQEQVEAEKDPVDTANQGKIEGEELIRALFDVP